MLPAEAGYITTARLQIKWTRRDSFYITTNEPIVTRRPLPTRKLGSRLQRAMGNSPRGNLTAQRDGGGDIDLSTLKDIACI